MVSGSSLSASQAYSSTTVSPWKVRGLGIFLASGGSIVMRAQSNDAPRWGSGARLWHHGSRARTPAAHELPGGRAHWPQRPKIEDYDDFVSIVVYGARGLGEPLAGLF